MSVTDSAENGKKLANKVVINNEIVNQFQNHFDCCG